MLQDSTLRGVSRRRFLLAAGAATLLPTYTHAQLTGATASFQRSQRPSASDLPAPVQRTTYYISASGHDASAGTDPAHPWRTVAPLNTIRFFGEDVQILFHGGDTFAGGLDIILAGRPGHRCLLGTYGPGMATLTDVADVTVHIAQLTNSEQFTVRNLRFIATPGTHYGTFGFVPVSDSNGLNMLSMRSTGAQLRGISIEHCEFRYSSAGLALDAHTGGDGFADVSIHNCVFDSTYLLGVFVWGSGANAGGPVDQNQNISVENCQFRHIYGNPNYPSEAQPIYVSCTTGIAIRRNLVSHCCGFGGVSPIGGSTAIGVTNARDFLIQYNEVCHTKSNSPWDGSAIDADQDTQNGEISYNLTYLNAGPAIQFGSYGGKTTADIAIHHNISYNDVRGNKLASVQGAVRAWGNTRRIQIFNNTIYLDGARAIGTPSVLSFEGVEHGTNSDFAVYNNIFKTTQGVAMIRPNGTFPGEYNPTHLSASDRFVANLYDSSGADLTIATDDGAGHYTTISSLAGWHAGGDEKLGATTRGVVGDAGLTAPGLFRPPPQGYLPSQPVSRIDNFDLTDHSLARGRAVDPWDVVTIHAPLAIGRLDFHGHGGPIVDIGAVAYESKGQ
jgi:hypothetical protein